MPGDPQVFKQEAQPGKMRHTFTKIRGTFPNLGMHAIIAQMFEYRKEFFKRPEFLSEDPWPDQVLTFMQSTVDRIKGEIDEITYRNTFDPGTALKVRQDKQRAFVERATDKGTTVESLAQDIESTHADEMLTSARQLAHSLTVDWTGNDPDYPQPTPGRLPNAAARGFVIGWDYLIVDMTNSNSANNPRTVNKHEAAEFNAKLADLFKLAELRGGLEQLPHVPTSLDRSQLDGSWNAAGEFDPVIGDGGPRAGEAPRNDNRRSKTNAG